MVFFYPQAQMLQLILIGVISLLVIMKSAGYMIFSISDYAHRTGLSDYLLGFVIVAICTSLPEISTAIFSSLVGRGSLVLGDVIGANIIDVTLILGLMTLFAGKMKVGGKKLFSIIYLPLALLVFGVDGLISRLEGIFLIIFFCTYLFVIIMKETGRSTFKKEVKFGEIWKDILIFGFALAALLLASRWMVYSAISLSTQLRIPAFLMGVVVIALGTTVPELTVGLKSVFSGARGMSFGNIFGSFATNICLVIGIAALINPIRFDTFSFYLSFAFMTLAISTSLFFMRKKEISWKQGVVLIGIYL
ncbi:MAG: hypothetical protein ABIA37_00900, partial [Candidatus Woesearchaeota archaeon]